MPDPIAFSSATPRHSLPLLFAGQAQKELTVNEALAGIDFLIQPVVEDTLSTPPVTPAVGQLWIVGTAPGGAWTGNAGKLAGWTEGGWRFFQPVVGNSVFDKSISAVRLYDGAWHRFSRPADPTGGTVVDSQCRSALTSLLALLTSAGVLST